MSNEIIVTESNQVNDIKISESSIAELGNRISLMKDFVSNQLVNHINGDYATIPGTPKPSLLKPGAEKLLLLFNLGFRFEIITQEIDMYAGDVSFLVKCEVYRKADNFTVGEYIAFCTNKEKKYEYAKPADIVNTILKMAQKRALVGAAIAATGASDYFTQDMEDSQAKKKVDASRFTQKPKTSNVGGYVIPVGKYKGESLEQVGREDVEKYVNYVTSRNNNIVGKLKEFIDTAREFLRE